MHYSIPVLAQVGYLFICQLFESKLYTMQDFVHANLDQSAKQQKHQLHCTMLL